MNDQALMPPADSPTTLVDEGRIARVARALCIADGRDPDGTVISRAGEEVPTEFGTLAEAPAWTSYAGEVRVPVDRNHGFRSNVMIGSV